MPKRKKFLPALISLFLLVLILLPGQFLPVDLYAQEFNHREITAPHDFISEQKAGFSWDEYSEDGMVEVLIKLKEKADTQKVAREVIREEGYSKDNIAVAVVGSLREVADNSQAPLLKYLEGGKTAGKVEELKSFYIINVIYARISVELIDEIAARPEVDSVRPNERIELIEPIEKIGAYPQGTGIEWNVERVNAPEVWGLGIDGSGVVVGIIDTGVDLEHEALLVKYRGYDPGGDHDHAYNWFDPYYDGRDEPDDVQGHGTHCIGTVLGSDLAEGNQIGVAPGAQWIAARGLNDDGNGAADALIASAQYLLAPTPNPDGSGEPDATKAPDIINNSWGGGYGLNEWYLEMVNNWRDAGIMPVFATGNAGPGYGTIAVPANYPASFAVAATDNGNLLAGFSSRGAAPYPHPDSMQPNISAPGVSVRSAIPGGGYESWSGTSMAAPHVSGVAALLLESDSTLTVEQLENMIMNSAGSLTDITYPESPNYGYGYGLINALEALTGDKDAPPVPSEPALPPALENAAYAWVNYTFNPLIPRGPVTLEVPGGSLGVLKYSDDLWVFGGDLVESILYTYAYNYFSEEYDIYAVDTATGDHSPIGLSGLDNNTLILGLAYDQAGDVLYASAGEWGSLGFKKNHLYTINLSTGQATKVGAITGIDDIVFGIAADADGNLYGCEMTYDVNKPGYLYSINKNSGEATLIGSLGFDAWYEYQDIAIDRESGKLYGLLYNWEAEKRGFYEINTSTGEASLLQYMDVFASGFAIPYDPPSLGTNANLAALAVNPGELDPDFAANITEYVVVVDYDVNDIDVTATLSDPKATMIISGENAASGVPKTVTLGDAGTNTVIDVVVTAEDGTTQKIYTIAVSRDEEPSLPEEGVYRLSGANRYITAVEISKSGWDSAETVILARGDDYADALTGVPLAYHLNAPILLTPTASLHDATEAEIDRLGADRVILLGGRAAISEAVKDKLEGKSVTVERIAGSNRYHTAALIAERLSVEGASFNTAFIAVGTNFADALAASSYAARRGEPILLTGTNQLPDATRNALISLGIINNYVCGGTAAISSEVFGELPNPTRISGANRYATALALAGEFLPDGATHVGIATGLNFPDAIAGGVWAAKYNTGILLVDGKASAPSAAVQNFIAAEGITAVTLFGGSGVVSRDMADWFEANLGD